MGMVVMRSGQPVPEDASHEIMSRKNLDGTALVPVAFFASIPVTFSVFNKGVTGSR